MSDYIEQSRATPSEVARTQDLLRLIPPNLTSVLDIGARDGHFTRLFASRFRAVTALDLTRPPFEIPGVETVAGDVTALDFPDNSFDLVFCAEVLEHIGKLEQACRELKRVSSQYVLIGVPFEQDTRVARLTCSACGKPNPPYGHLNSFTEARLLTLFDGMELVERSFVGKSSEATNSLAVWLQDFASNPWGSYEQEETCIHCGAQIRESPIPAWKRAVGLAGLRLQQLQTRMAPEHGNWIHILFRKSR